MLLLIANWKMAPDKPLAAIDLAKKTSSLAKTHKNLSVIACVPFIHISSVLKNAKAPLLIGAQNVSMETTVPHTGMTSAAMLQAQGVIHCIIGHSEVRAEGDTNEVVREKMLRLLEKKITPIICIGERARDTQGWYLSEVKDQIETILSVLPANAHKKIILAYEPVWAIGANAVREATPRECLEMVIYIRKILADHIGEKAASTVPILYGGSVNEFNATSFITEGKVQGFLVGRVSLEPKRFADLAKAMSK